MGWTARVIDAGAAFRNPLEDVEDGLFITTGDRRAKVSQFWVLLVLASVIAAGGVIGDATPAVIGAMIVAPLATPIYGVALATVTGSRSNLGRSLLLLVEGIVVNILIGVLMGMITFERMPLDANPQVLGRTAPTLLDLMVAVTVGVAGSFALVRRDVSNILAGVAIAISLVPVLAVVGITLGSWRLDLALGAFILFLTNAAAIIVAGIVVFTAAGYQRDAAARGAHVGRRAKWIIAIFVVVLVIPLAGASYRTYEYQKWKSDVETAAQAWAQGTDWSVEQVLQSGSDILITAVGPGSPPATGTLVTDVRRTVPTSVGVTLVAGSGEEVQL
jgi:uncharacterized hydrophobic protein (TIGR00271 family)